MAKKIQIDIEVNGKMQKATVSAKKLAAALGNVEEGTDKATKSQRTQDRVLKGSAKASSNSTKNFSKMAQGITGGLVPAYATLAANLFAVSAAFNFLKRAAQLQQLEESQVAYAARTGVALQSVTERLRETSQGMLGFQEAAQAAAIGVAKGFSPNQLNKLAEGALKASQALGRDFADAFDRLVRGVSKAEPELLDELGITLRLEQATRSYASALGLQADQLTETQRSQAVLVETQRQLDLLFGGKPLDANPFVQVQKAFEDLIRTITEFFLPIFKSIASIISANIGAAITVFGFFALSIFKAVVPMETLDAKTVLFTQMAEKEFTEATQAVDKYTAAIEKSKRTAEQTRSQGKVDFKSASQAAVEQGAPSKILAKAANEGFDSLRKTDQKNLKRFLDAAETNVDSTGKVIKGAFKGVSISIIRDMKKSLDNINTRTVDMGNKWTRTTNRMKLEWRRAQAFFQKAQAKTTTVVVAGFKRIGRAFTKVLKLFSVAGIALIIIQSFQEFKYQLDNIVRSIATAIDGLISMLPGVSDFSFFQDVYKDSAAEDYLQGLAAQGEAFKDVQAKSQGLKDRIRALREDTNASAESFKDLTKQINKLENDGEKGLAAVARGMQKTLQTNVKATAGAADLVREIESLRNMKGEGADSAATERLVELEAALKNIGDIVPEVKDLLAEGLSGTALADALFKLEQEAQGANRSITDFNDGLTVLEAAFTSGNINQIATSFFNAKKRLVELNKNVDPDQAAAFTKEFAALAKDFGGVEALEKRLESSVDKQKEFIARDAALSVQQASTAQIANKFAKERATREDDLRAKALSIEKINQKILDTEIEMAQLGGEQDAEKQRLLDQLHAQLGAETGILNLTKERKTFLDSVSQIQEKISDLGREEKILSFRQNINKELEKQLGIQKQLTDLQISEAERLFNQQVSFLTDDNAANVFADKERIQLQANVALQEALLEKRKLANQQEFDLKIAQITAEEKMQQMKRKQTLAEMQLLKLTLEDENKQTPGNASTIKSIADLTELMNEMADGGSFAKSISTSASMSRQLAENMKKANDSKLEDAVTNSKRALENASALNDVLNTAGDAFSGALNDSFNALFDSLSDKTKSLSESLKDIARSFIKTLQKAITQRFIVDPILDALDNLINPNKKNPGQLIKQAHVQGATTVGNTIVAGAKVQKAALESGADTIKDKMEEALQNMIEVCCCKEPPKVGGDPVDVTNVNEFEKAFERALNNKQKDDDIIDILRQGITMAAGGMGGGEEMPTGMGYPRGSEPVEPGMTSKMLDFLIGEKGDHAFRDGEYLGRVLETDLHGPPEPGTVRREDVDIFSGDQVSHDQRAGGFFGEGGPIEGLGKNLKSTFGTFTEKLGNLFSGEGDFLAKLGDVFTSGGDIFTNLFSDFGGIFSDLLGGLTGGLSDMLGGLLGGAGGGGGGIMDLISMGAGFFGFANGGYTSQMKDYSDGGVAKGSRAGYPAILHGNEAVVPLPGGNKIPVEMSGAPGGGTVNAGVTVNINQATGAVDSTTEGDAQDAKRFAEQVSLVVRREVQNQQRSGGLLSPYGGS